MKKIYTLCLFLAGGVVFAETDNIFELKNWQISCSNNKENLIKSQVSYKPVDSLTNLTTCLESGVAGYALLKTEFSIKDPSQMQGLLLGRIMWADKTMLNGRLLGETGGFPDEPYNFFNIHRFYKIPAGLLNEAGTNELKILVYLDTEGGLLDIPLVGDYPVLKKKAEYRKFFSNTVNLIIFFLLLTVAGYHLLLFYKRRQDKENLYFAIMLFAYSGYEVNMFIWSMPFIPPISYLVWNKLVMSFLFIFLYFMGVFFNSIFLWKPHHLVQKFLLGLTILPITVMAFIFDYHTFFEFRKIELLFIPAFLITYLVQLIVAVKSGSRLAKIIMTGIAPAIGVGLVDLAQSILQWKTDIYLGPLGIPVFLGSIAFSLGEKFVNVHNEVEYLNRNLENKVKERTEKLQQSLNKIRALKEQQDADYFLTSLLLKPLATDSSHREKIEVEFFIRQKKQFTFRGKQHEIGGDLNSAHELELSGKTYTVFINADAMGKSMQGAGGALTLGVVFKAKVNRTQLTEKEKNKSPELWIKECWLELQKVFETFEGSMMVSCVLGLVDRESGLMYFCNSEHPYPVLFRDNKAGFLPENNITYKLGAPQPVLNFRISLFQMQPHDIIISGSDGRDDLFTGMEGGDRVINHDENLFVECVEKGAGQLAAIVKEIEACGELTDDLSLLSVKRNSALPPMLNEDDYRQLSKNKISLNEIETLIQQYPADHRLYEFQAKYYLKQKSYNMVIDVSEKIYRLNPADNTNIRRLASCEKKLKHYTRAIDWGEMLRLREPRNNEILVFLAEVYSVTKRYETALKLLDMVLESKVHDYTERAEKLKKQIITRV